MNTIHWNRLLKSGLLIWLGVLFAATLFSGIHFQSFDALLIAALLLSLCNVFLKPLLMVVALPFIVLTFGLGIWLINAWLFLLVASWVEGFVVDSFAAALAGAMVVSLTGWVANTLFGPPHKRGVRVQVQGRRTAADPAPRRASERAQTLDSEDVIDI